MNTKRVLIASAAVAAVLSFGVPAHAQLLGGNAGGGLGGALWLGRPHVRPAVRVRRRWVDRSARTRRE